jgi:hypothetical protein
VQRGTSEILSPTKAKADAWSASSQLAVHLPPMANDCQNLPPSRDMQGAESERLLMRLVKLDTPEGIIYINPEHVVAVVKGLRDTKIVTVSGPHVVTDPPEVVARMLGMEEISVDVTPRAVGWAKDQS